MEEKRFIRTPKPFVYTTNYYGLPRTLGTSFLFKTLVSDTDLSSDSTHLKVPPTPLSPTSGGRDSRTVVEPEDTGRRETDGTEGENRNGPLKSLHLLFHSSRREKGERRLGSSSTPKTTSPPYPVPSPPRLLYPSHYSSGESLLEPPDPGQVSVVVPLNRKKSVDPQ